MPSTQCLNCVFEIQVFRDCSILDFYDLFTVTKNTQFALHKRCDISDVREITCSSTQFEHIAIKPYDED